MRAFHIKVHEFGFERAPLSVAITLQIVRILLLLLDFQIKIKEHMFAPQLGKLRLQT